MAALRIDTRVGGLIAGFLFLAAVVVVPPAAGLPEEAWRVAGVTLVMATFWVTGALPIPVTSLLPLVLFPILDIAPIRDAAAPYADPIIFLFMGGFILGLCMQRWSLHLRIGLNVLAAVGTSPKRLLAGVLIATAFVSMWVSNTSTAIMMLPVALSILALYDEHLSGDEQSRRNLGVVLTLAVAYASSIGGLGTLIGTPTNAFLRGHLERAHGVELGFAQWMALAVPLVIVLLIGCWIVLARMYPVRVPPGLDARDAVAAQMDLIGRITPAERRIALVFAVTAAAWITRPLYDDLLPQVDDTVVAMLGALVLFFLPSGMGDGSKMMSWEDAKGLPWGVLLLFGGGLSLAAAIDASELDAWVGRTLQALEAWPVFLIVGAATLIMILFTELTSNTAAAAVFLPLASAIALSVGFDPLLIAIPLTLTASCGFMMPVGTPPNAIAYASGRITIAEMVRAGIWMNLLSILLILAVSYAFVGWLFVD